MKWLWWILGIYNLGCVVLGVKLSFLDRIMYPFAWFMSRGFIKLKGLKK